MTDLLAEALTRFDAIYRDAQHTDRAGAALMALATADRESHASVRTVRFAGLIENRFTFFANRTSGKGRQLDDNPWAGLCFFWPNAEQQVLIEGSVDVLSNATADELWRTRPRAAALMAWASNQSREASGPGELDTRYHEALVRFADERVPRPPDWLAYGVRPTRIEFWRGDWERRNDREAYFSGPDGWRFAHLDP